MSKECKIKVKGNKHIWKYRDVKIVFSDGDFQANDEYAHVSGIEDMLYMYYTVTIYRMQYYGKKKDKKWHKVAVASTHDFPCIDQLKYALEKLLGDEIPLSECREIEYMHNEEKTGAKGYIYEYESGGFGCDDAYSIKRTINILEDGERQEFYSLYVGASINPQGWVTSSGVYITEASKDSMQKLLDFINGFINSMIVNHNDYTKIENAKAIKSFSCEKGRLCEKDEDGNITSMHIVGDKGDFVILVGDLDSNNYHSNSYNYSTIQNIKEDCIVVGGGYFKSNKDEDKQDSGIIPINKLLFIMDNVSDEKINYSEKEIITDFKLFLSKDEIEEFTQYNHDWLYDKWAEVIINRYWMYREEHNLPKRTGKQAEFGSSQDNVHLSAMHIIESIQNDALYNHFLTNPNAKQ